MIRCKRLISRIFIILAVSLLIVSHLLFPFHTAADEPLVIDQCVEQGGVTLHTLDLNVQNACCHQGLAFLRKDCLNEHIERFRSMRDVLGADFVSNANQILRELRDSDCNNPGRRPIDNPVDPNDPNEDDSGDNNGGTKKKKKNKKCRVKRRIFDGPGGWLHKPVSDSTGSIVNLFPSNESPSACRYETKTGRVIRQAFSSGRTNGNRETIRPAGGGSCSGFPNNMVVSCKIGRKRHCWKIPDPCNRYD